MLPSGFVQRMRALLGEEWEAFLAAYDRPRNTALRFNPLKCSDIALPFCGEIVPWEPRGRYLLPNTRAGLHVYHDAGVYYLQEPSAMAPARLLAPKPNERVLDLCAAPGGKSTQLAAAMNGTGLLVCNEIQPKRARILSSNIERMGITNALVLNEHPAKLARRFPRYFDRILVDAPCSGEGMFRKEEAAVSDWSEETVEMCAARQAEILDSAAQMLAPNGRLVYSTCTFSPQENEGVISAFLKTHPDFSVEQMDAPWFSAGNPDWVEQPADGLEHTFRLWPHKLRGEGHYAAVLRKNDVGVALDGSTENGIPLPKEVEELFSAWNVELPEGKTLLFGETLYRCPFDTPSLNGLHVLRVGLELGQLRKGRFIPAHALALWLKEFPTVADYSADSAELAAYLRGETLLGAQRGWVLVCADGLSLGWAKGSDGVLKNHYPKGLRRI